MPVHGTTLNSLYNRPNDNGKATDIQQNDLFYMQRGDGSDRDKAIKGKDVLLSSSLVTATTGDDTPGHLINKLYNSDTIAFDDVNVSGQKKVTAEIKTNSVESTHLKDDCCTTNKIPDGNVTTPKLANNSVTGEKFDSSVIDQQYTAVNVMTTDIVDQNTAACDVKVHTFSGVGTGGFVDVLLYVNNVSEYMTDVKFEIRKTGSATVDSEFSIGTPASNKEYSRRMVVKNSASTAANYELHLTCKANFSPGGVPVSGFQAFDADIRGISLA